MRNKEIVTLLLVLASSYLSSFLFVNSAFAAPITVETHDIYGPLQPCKDLWCKVKGTKLPYCNQEQVMSGKCGEPILSSTGAPDSSGLYCCNGQDAEHVVECSQYTFKCPKGTCVINFDIGVEVDPSRSGLCKAAVSGIGVEIFTE